MKSIKNLEREIYIQAVEEGVKEARKTNKTCVTTNPSDSPLLYKEEIELAGYKIFETEINFSGDIFYISTIDWNEDLI
jgi:hypothetical protein